MSEFQHRWAQGRRNVVVGTLVAAGLLAAPVQQAFAQSPAPAPATGQSAPAQPAQPAQPASPGISFDADSGILLMYIKPDKTADFESVMAKLHEALAKSDRPERRQQAAGWKLFKAAEPGPNGAVTYVNIMSPALKGSDYTMTKILYEVYPTEVQQLFPLLRDSFAGGMGKLNLSLVQDFGGQGRPAGAAPAATPPPQQ